MTAAIGGLVTAQTQTFAISASAALDAVLSTVYVPNKATILDVILEVTAAGDTGATLTLDVGDSSGPATADDDRFIAAFSGQAAGSIRASDSAGLLEGTYTYRGLKGTDDSQVQQGIEVTVKAAAATGAAGSGRITVVYCNNTG
jgi:hypothetical protein